MLKSIKTKQCLLIKVSPTTYFAKYNQKQEHKMHSKMKFMEV